MNRKAWGPPGPALSWGLPTSRSPPHPSLPRARRHSPSVLSPGVRRGRPPAQLYPRPGLPPSLLASRPPHVKGPGTTRLPGRRGLRQGQPRKDPVSRGSPGSRAGGGWGTSLRSRRAPWSREEGRRAPRSCWAGLGGPQGAGQSPGPCNCWQPELTGAGGAGGARSEIAGRGQRHQSPGPAAGRVGDPSDSLGASRASGVSPHCLLGAGKGVPGPLPRGGGEPTAPPSTPRETAQPSAACPQPKRPLVPSPAC